MRKNGHPWLILVAATLFLAGCAPSLSPLYRDFEAPPEPSDAEMMQRLEKALREAGWTIASTGENIIITQPRTLQDWGLYEINVHLEVLPMNESYARVLFHPFRAYFFGHETKLLFLKSDIREELLPPLEDALSEHGFKAVGTARSRALDSEA